MPSGNLVLSGERVLDVTVAGEDVVNVVSVAVDSGLVLARTFRDGIFYHKTVAKLRKVNICTMCRVSCLLGDLG